MITERDRAKTLALAQSVPAARTEGLVTTSTDDELLVYDQERHHIHHLNHTAAVIWRLCDGRRSVEQLAQAASLQEAEPVNADAVRLAIDKLAEANLLVAAVPDSLRLSTQTRRSFMKRAAVAGVVAVPAIVSMTAPASASSANCGQPCTCNDGCRGGSCSLCSMAGFWTVNPNGTCTFHQQSFCCKDVAGKPFYCGPSGGWQCGQGNPPSPCTSPPPPPPPPSGIKQNSLLAPQSQTAPTDTPTPEPTNTPVPQDAQPPAPQDTQPPVDQQPTDQSQNAPANQTQSNSAPADAPSPTPTDTPPPPPPPAAPNVSAPTGGNPNTAGATVVPNVFGNGNNGNNGNGGG